jgi:uncharacterized coiled-coil protein SlyX
MQDQLKGLPPWLQAAVLLGVPSVIAMFMVYMLTTGVSRRILAIEAQQAAQTQILELVKVGIENRQRDADEVREHFDHGVERLETLLRAMCVAVATTAEARNRCSMAGGIVQ